MNSPVFLCVDTLQDDVSKILAGNLEIQQTLEGKLTSVTLNRVSLDYFIFGLKIFVYLD